MVLSGSLGAQILPDQLELLLSQHPKVLAAIESAESARHEAAESFLFLLPDQASVSVSVASDYSLTDDSATSLESRLAFRQVLFSWQQIASVRNRKALARAAELYAAWSREQALFEILRLLVMRVQNDHSLELARRNFNRIESYTNGIETRFRAGDISRTEVDFARARLSSAGAEIYASENSRIRLEREFLALWPQSLQTVAKEVYSHQTDSLMNRLNELSSAITLPEDPEGAIRARNDIRQAHLLLEAFSHLRQQESAAHLPELHFSYSTELSEGTFLQPNAGTPSWEAGFSLSIPLGGIAGAALKARSGKALVKTKQLELEQLIREAVAAVQWELQGYANRSSQLELLRKAEQSAEDALEGIIIEFNAGERTAFDIIDAQNVFTLNAKERIRVELQQLSSGLNLIKNMGGLHLEIFR